VTRVPPALIRSSVSHGTRQIIARGGGGKGTVHTALRLHARAFYSTVRSSPSLAAGVCVLTADYAAEEEGHAGTARTTTSETYATYA
jgi:hypothetical protein